MVTPTNHRSNDIAVRSLYRNIEILRHWLHIPKSFCPASTTSAGRPLSASPKMAKGLKRRDDEQAQTSC